LDEYKNKVQCYHDRINKQELCERNIAF